VTERVKGEKGPRDNKKTLILRLDTSMATILEKKPSSKGVFFFIGDAKQRRLKTNPNPIAEGVAKPKGKPIVEDEPEKHIWRNS